MRESRRSYGDRPTSRIKKEIKVKRFLTVIAAVIIGAGLFQGCTTLEMRNSEKEIAAKWERFKSIKPYPYVPTGLVTIDISNKAICDLSNQICYEVIIPYIDLDKEGLISVYAQFIEDVGLAMKENEGMSKEGAVHYVLALWTRKYGAGNVDRLLRAIPFIQNMQTSNQVTKAAARLLLQSAGLLQTLDCGVAQLRHEVKNVETIIKLSYSAAQLMGRMDQLCWALHFLDVLKEDQAVETRAITAYIESFKTKEI